MICDKRIAVAHDWKCVRLDFAGEVLTVGLEMGKACFNHVARDLGKVAGAALAIGSARARCRAKSSTLLIRRVSRADSAEMILQIRCHACRSGSVHAAPGQEIGEHADGGQGRLEFVRNVADEIGPCCASRICRPDVVRDQREPPATMATTSNRTIKLTVNRSVFADLVICPGSVR